MASASDHSKHSPAQPTVTDARKVFNTMVADGILGSDPPGATLNAVGTKRRAERCGRLVCVVGRAVDDATVKEQAELEGTRAHFQFQQFVPTVIRAAIKAADDKLMAPVLAEDIDVVKIPKNKMPGVLGVPVDGDLDNSFMVDRFTAAVDQVKRQNLARFGGGAKADEGEPDDSANRKA